MKEESKGCPWPADMERRRIAALQKFQRQNPDFMLQNFVPRQLQVTNKNGSRSENRGPSSVSPLSSALKRKGKPSRAENKWCLATTLELLEQMKVYVRAKKLHCIGENMEKWKAIAVHLSNPRNLELSRLARSSMVRFDNIRRYYRTGKRAQIEVEVQNSMIDYFRICELHQTLGSKKSSPRSLSTMDLALRYTSSPSPPLTLATGKLCRRQILTGSGEPLHYGNDDPMSSGDESIDCSDDDNAELFLTSENLENQIRMPPPPAAKRESSDEEDAGWTFGPRSQVVRNRLRRPSARGTETASALLRGNPNRTLTYG